MDNDQREQIFHKYMHTSKMTFHKTHERLEKVGLYRGQPPLLMALWHKDKQSRRELCEHMDRQPATISKMVKRLENHEFVTSRQDPEDSRISRVCLTDKGREIEVAIHKIHTDLHRHLFKDISEDELMLFEDILDKIKGNIKEMSAKSREGQYETND